MAGWIEDDDLSPSFHVAIASHAYKCLSMYHLDYRFYILQTVLQCDWFRERYEIYNIYIHTLECVLGVGFLGVRSDQKHDIPSMQFKHLKTTESTSCPFSRSSWPGSNRRRAWIQTERTSCNRAMKGWTFQDADNAVFYGDCEPTFSRCRIWDHEIQWTTGVKKHKMVQLIKQTQVLERIASAIWQILKGITLDSRSKTFIEFQTCILGCWCAMYRNGVCSSAWSSFGNWFVSWLM